MLGLYREALNSINSPLYQLFCYFKIMDGFGHIQADRISKKLSNIVVEEIMPPGHKYSGKRFNYIKNQINKDFRTAFAHFNLNQDSIDQSPDDMKYIYEAIFTIPDCQFIARKYIEAILSQT